MTTLIVGGTSGLGLALAKEFADAGDKVIATGRTDPPVDYLEFKKIDFSQPNVAENVNKIVSELPPIERLVYAAGFWQSGSITELSDEDIERKLNIGARGLIYFARDLLKKDKNLNQLVTITSMSQWNPSKLEPIYNFIKAGSGNMSQGLAKDGHIAKVLVVEPSDMKEGHDWTGTQQDNKDTMLDKGWVAKQILNELERPFTYKAIQILRKPARVEVVETRD